MSIPRRLRFVHAQVAWMVATVLGLAVLGAFSFDLFLVLSFLGVLILAEVTSPVNVTPAWRRRLRLFVVLGLVGFAVVAGRRLLEVAPPEVLP